MAEPFVLAVILGPKGPIGPTGIEFMANYSLFFLLIIRPGLKYFSRRSDADFDFLLHLNNMI